MKKLALWMASAAVVASAFTGVAQAEGALTEQLNARIAKLSVEQQAALLVLLDSGSAGAAAAEAPAAVETDPKKALLGGIATILTAAKEENLDAVMSMISDSFEHPQLGGKDELRDFL